MTASPAPELGSLAEIAASVRSGERSARAILATSLDRVRELEGKLHCFNEVTIEAAEADADAVDRLVRSGQDPGPLAGVPVALKDNLCTAGIADDLLVEDPGGMVAALRRDGREPAP